MGPHSISPSSAPSDSTWLQLEAKLAELARLASQELPIRDFSERFLGSCVEVLGAQGGRWWNARPLEIVGDFNLVPPQDDFGRRIGDCLKHAINSGQITELEVAADADSPDAASHIAIVCPVMVGSAPRAAIEIHMGPDISPAEMSGVTDLVAAVGELAADHFRQSDQRELQHTVNSSDQVLQFATLLQRGVRLADVAFPVVNEGRVLVECDRLWLVTYNRRRCRAVSASGIARIDRRADLVCRLEDLAAAVCRWDRPYWSSDASADTPPQIGDLAQHFCDESSATAVGVWPLITPLDAADDSAELTIIGALVAEHFQQPTFSDKAKHRIELLGRQVTSALQRCRFYDSLPLASLWLWLGRTVLPATVRSWPKALWISLILASMVVASLLFKTEFTVNGHGELQPVCQQHLFAPADAVVQRVDVDHGDQVRSGQVLIQLSQLELDGDWVEVVGEIDTTRQALAALQASRLDANSQSTRVEDHQRTADQERLSRRLKSLTEQRELLQQQRAELEISCPMSGRVLTWQLEESLTGRPVRRGQRLLTVADTDGPWELQLHLPDHYIGYVLTAGEKSATPCRVSYYLATDPSQLRDATIKEISDSVRIEAPHESTVLIKAALVGTESLEVRPGTSVIARVHCGRRSLAYVWLHDLYEAIRYRIWF